MIVFKITTIKVMIILMMDRADECNKVDGEDNIDPKS
jgi:hypothetical protein